MDDDDEDNVNIARALINEAILDYERLTPETNEDDDVPEEVQRQAISKAAFLQLAAAVSRHSPRLKAWRACRTRTQWRRSLQRGTATT